MKTVAPAFDKHVICLYSLSLLPPELASSSCFPSPAHFSHVPESFFTKCFGIQSTLNLLPPAFFFPVSFFALQVGLKVLLGHTARMTKAAAEGTEEKC